MSTKRIHRELQRTPEERERIERIRQRFQTERPTPEELLASGEVAEFLPTGEYLSVQDAVHALKKARQQLNLTLATVAERSNMDTGAISRLENGIQTNPTVSTLVRYACALVVTLAWTIKSTTQPTFSRRFPILSRSFEVAEIDAYREAVVKRGQLFPIGSDV